MNEPEFDAFADCWNAGRFFEAHEVLEGLWMRTRDECQRGLIQLAAALYHVQRANLRGARTMLDRALPRLRTGSKHPMPVDVGQMIAYAERLRAALTPHAAAALIADRPMM